MPYPSAPSPLLVPRAMSLLDQLWDDTIAGPRPDNGLGRLRKFRTFDLLSDSGKESYGGNLRSYRKEEEAVWDTRRVMIVKPPGFDNLSGSRPVSPAGSTPPTSPFSGSNKGSFRFCRRSTSGADERSCDARRTSTPPPPPHIV